IVVLLGGRVAEELTLDDISTGASNDLERVSATARNMVTKYGMSSKLGPMTFGDSEDEVFLGNSFASKKNYSEEVAYEIDKEISRIVDESYKQTKKILQDNMDRLQYVAKALLVYETLDADQFLKAFNKELPLEVLETEKSNQTNNIEVVEKKESFQEKIDIDEKK
ncbi:MAG TPA: zinc metalloprotease, partial [Romboutsia timonensis]|nr:zinc metalloprotease [Romboutsia timonensis]